MANPAGDHYDRAMAVESPSETVKTAGLVVRAATAVDRAAAARLLGASLVEMGVPVDEDGIARAVELALSASGAAWLVMATAHGMPVGVLLANPAVSVEHGGAALRLEAVYVAPERRGRGIERALVEYVAEEARTNGMRALEAEAATSQGTETLASCGFVSLERARMRRSV
jgi:GNAT superfamily N-acetyltransferase